MKRWILLTVLIVVLSTVGTLAVQFMPVSGTSNDLPIALGKRAASARTGLSPKAVLDEETIFEFGTLPQRTTGKHTWTVKNEGKGELELWMISSTCSCTLAKFKNGEKAVVPPGESTEIVLEYETRENNGDYVKGAEIGTNDPDLPRFPLQVKGKVYPAVMTFPPESTINLGSISNDKDEHVIHVALFSRDRPETKVGKPTTSSPEQIVTESAPTTEAELKAIPSPFEVKQAETVTIKVKGGLPLGAFREEVIIPTDHPNQPEVRLTLIGRMVGPVNVLPSPITMHEVYGNAGATSEASIVVREQRPTEIKVKEAPKQLKVEVAPGPGGKPGRYRLVVTVPPGTPAEQIEGEIVLETDHPKASRLTVPVSVWVLNSN